MKSYRASAVVEDPNQVVLKDLPFQPGETVDVVIRPHRDSTPDVAGEMRSLFEQLQSLPNVQKLTDEDITAEIEAHRSGR